MAATEDQIVTRLVPNSSELVGVSAAAEIFAGTFVSVNTGAHALVAGEQFVGLARNYVDNTAGLLDAKSVEVEHNVPIRYAIAAITTDEIGDKVYASDDNTLTLTAGANSFVGYVIGVPETGIADVRLEVSS